MIEKINKIENLGVYSNFDWDKEVVNKKNKIETFNRINILYGRNYSGKTTLSRIFRAMETGALSDKFENPSFCVSFDDKTKIRQNELHSNKKTIRVFNEDFIRDNLRFINHPDDGIEPFAILGDDNNKITKEIEALESELGSNEQGNETKLYAQNVQLLTKYNEIKNTLDEKEKNKTDLLKNKATSRQTGIKYKADRFGDQNYDIRKLEADIDTVQSSVYKELTKDKLSQYENLIVEKPLQPIIQSLIPVLHLGSFITQTKVLVTKEISSSDKIEELVKDAVLNRWVKDGRDYHKTKRNTCAFCGNEISNERWEALDRHFDEESDRLEKDIDSLIEKIDSEKQLVTSSLSINKADFYTKFHNQIDELSATLTKTIDKYFNSLTQLRNLLKTRKDDIINPQIFLNPEDSSENLRKIWETYEKIKEESNAYTTSLKKDQESAKKELRLAEVSNFIKEINYPKIITDIEKARNNLSDIKKEKEELEEQIQDKEKQIIIKKQELNDEEKGAQKVNDYLNNSFGHRFLSLSAQKEEEPNDETKRIRFEVVRDGKKAYHLSEGECSLIAFCYFLAKLDDIKTHGEKPIIWIDDPISSLDGNHIFFVYSLLKTKIVDSKKFEQLFVSTHNLDFLKYLKRLVPQKQENNVRYFIVIRHDKKSTITVMPDYLKKYVTEFNYLFHQIYKCANIDIISDSNYTTFYNFGNDARKFLEMYLYYKFPDDSGHMEKLKKLFGNNEVPAVLSDRINNEYSHMAGVFERGAEPIEVPEMKKVAQQILDILKQDEEQYKALVNSIGCESSEATNEQ